MSKTIKVIPHQKGLNRILHNDGHSFDETLSELIDNARDQKASIIKFKKGKNRSQKYLAISNNGYSIDNFEDMIKIGSGHRRSDDSIGTYGVGLKQFLSYGINYYIVSKKATTLKAWTPGKEEFTYQELKSKDIPAYVKKITNSELKGFRSGVVIVLEYDNTVESVIENETVKDYISTSKKSYTNYFQLAADKYFSADDIEVYLNGKKIKKRSFFGEKTLIRDIDLSKDFPGVEAKIYRTKEQSEKRRGTFLLWNNRLVNIKGKHFFAHSNYNGIVMILKINSWNNPVIKDGYVKLTNQKNDFSLVPGKHSLYYQLEKIQREEKDKNNDKYACNKAKKLTKENLLDKKIKVDTKKYKKSSNGTLVLKNNPKKVIAKNFTGIKEIDTKFKEEYGKTLSELIGHDHYITEARYWKSNQKWEFVSVLKGGKYFNLELQSLPYYQDIIQEIATEEGFSFTMETFYAKDDSHTGKDKNKIKSRIKEYGISLKEVA